MGKLATLVFGMFPHVESAAASACPTHVASSTRGIAAMARRYRYVRCELSLAESESKASKPHGGAGMSSRRGTDVRA